MHVIAVNLPGAGYRIHVEPNLLAAAGSILRTLSHATRAAVITDTHVADKWLAPAEASLRAAGFDVLAITLPPGEQHKTLDSVQTAYDALLEWRIERTTPVVALGGGVIGDVAGFIAATVLRGVPFVQMPTTLLSMVDASVGGKTGVNHAAGKNLIGAFHQPLAVLIDPEVLRTLPPRELRGGLAECIKHDLIRDADGFAELERNIPRALQLDIDYLTLLIAHNVAIKARIVEADPFEKGERAHLNFGHTFAHAIETVTSHAYSHGEAVALGMVAAANLSRTLGLISSGDVTGIRDLISNAGLPTAGLRADPEALLSAMSSDKKVQSGRLRFVLLDGIGRAVVRDDVPADAVVEAIRAIGR